MFTLNKELQQRLEIGFEAVKELGSISWNYFKSQSFNINLKSDLTFVTNADLECEHKFRNIIKTHFPDDCIVGEEFELYQGNSHYIWYVDPIDGTQAFCKGVPLFGNLACVSTKDYGQSIGFIFMPCFKEMVIAATSCGCWWIKNVDFNKDVFVNLQQAQKAHTSQINSLDKATWCTSWFRGFKQTKKEDLFLKLCESIGTFRGWGDCYGYLLVATGRVEIMIDPIVSIWDIAPMKVILEEAGGCFFDFNFNSTINTTSAIATNKFLKEDVIKIIKKYT